MLVDLVRTQATDGLRLDGALLAPPLNVPRSTALAPAMETYAVRLLPRGEFVERHLRRADAERYLEVYNRIMRLDASRAELVREPAEEYDAGADQRHTAE